MYLKITESVKSVTTLREYCTQGGTKNQNSCSFASNCYHMI